jgi:hypothetical protein
MMAHQDLQGGSAGMVSGLKRKRRIAIHAVCVVIGAACALWAGTSHNLPVDVKDGNAIRTTPAGLSVFRIGDDGKLTYVRK